MRILPSIASADILRIAEELDRLKDWPWWHFDVEDGRFTPNLTFGQKMMRKVGAHIAPRQLDVHLMVENPLDWLATAAESGAGSISAHLEALRFPLLFLHRARSMGMRAGLALNVGTPVEAVDPFLSFMDFLLVMTSEPDDRGEELLPYACDKAVFAAKRFAAKRLPVEVLADGGLNEKALIDLWQAGVAGCVLGRLVFEDENSAARLKALANRCR